MIYLDYSATTPVNTEVLNTFNKVCIDYIGNANSMHALGVKSNELATAATKQIANILGVLEKEIIYTSGSSESNNLAIKGICLKYQNRGKHIITTRFEHSSVYGPLSYLENSGFVIDFVNTDSYGRIDIDHLKELLTDETILVTLSSVNSEIGLLQDVNSIGQLLKNYPKCFFHVDMTQSIGKIKIDLKNVDLISFSAHKFYGLKGIGALIKKKSIVLEPIIHGGKSTTVFRSGTPALPLIASLAKALRLATNDIDKHVEHVKELNEYLKEKLSSYEHVFISSNQYCVPHILNFSVIGVKPETMMHALEEKDIYISTQTACSKDTSRSNAVYSLTNSEAIATSSLRVSLSYLTTKEECEKFVEVFDDCYNRLTNLR